MRNSSADQRRGSPARTRAPRRDKSLAHDPLGAPTGAIWPCVSRFSGQKPSENRETDGQVSGSEAARSSITPKLEADSPSVLRRVASLTVALCLTACAHAPSGKVAAALAEPGQTLQLVESGEALIAPSLRLTWEGDSWRGAAWGALAELEASASGINGFAGDLPVHLVVERGEEKTTVRGLLLGQLGELRVSAKELEGTVGRCSYDLKSTDGHHYAGYRSCSAQQQPEPTRVDLQTLGEHPLSAGRIAPLLLFLAR